MTVAIDGAGSAVDKGGEEDVRFAGSIGIVVGDRIGNRSLGRPAVVPAALLLPAAVGLGVLLGPGSNGSLRVDSHLLEKVRARFDLEGDCGLLPPRPDRPGPVGGIDGDKVGVLPAGDGRRNDGGSGGGCCCCCSREGTEPVDGGGAVIVG